MSIYLFSGNKGGVGKSMACVAFIESQLATGRDPIIIEADRENPDVGRKYDERARYFDLTNQEGWAKLADTVDSARARDIIINLPAQVGEAWTKHAPLFFEALGEAGEIPAYVFFVINRQKDSVALLKNALATDPSNGAIKAWLVVKNLYFGDSEKFVLWQGSKTRADVLAKGAEIELPELADWVADKIAGRPTTVAAAAEDTQAFTISERTAIKRWLRDSAAEFARVETVWAV